MVTALTVGYGDKVPSTILGKVIAIIWMMMGVYLLSLFIAALTSALVLKRLSPAEEVNIENIADVVMFSTAALHTSVMRCVSKLSRQKRAIQPPSHLRIARTQRDINMHAYMDARAHLDARSLYLLLHLQGGARVRARSENETVRHGQRYPGSYQDCGCTSWRAWYSPSSPVQAPPRGTCISLEFHPDAPLSVNTWATPVCRRTNSIVFDF